MYYEKGFIYLFWGLLISFVNFEINQISILPNFVGYALLLYGIFKISEEDSNIKRLVPWTYVMILLSFIVWSLSFIRTNETTITNQEGFITTTVSTIDFFFIMQSFETLFTIGYVIVLMHYFLHLLRDTNHSSLIEVFKRRRNFFVITNVLLLIVMSMAPFLGIVILISVFVLVILAFIAFVRILMSAYRIMKLAQEENVAFTKDIDESLPFYKEHTGSTIGIVIVIMISWFVHFI